MKLKVPLAIAGGLALLALAHIWVNVGFDRFARDVRVLFGAERSQLMVGYLPVT
jgi:hypothetical protein